MRRKEKGRRGRGELSLMILKVVAESGESTIYGLSKQLSKVSGKRENPGKIQGSVETLLRRGMLSAEKHEHHYRILKVLRLTPYGFVGLMYGYILPRRNYRFLARTIKQSSHLFPTLSKYSKVLLDKGVLKEFVEQFYKERELREGFLWLMYQARDFERYFAYVMLLYSEKFRKMVKDVPELRRLALRWLKDAMIEDLNHALDKWGLYTLLDPSVGEGVKKSVLELNEFGLRFKLKLGKLEIYLDPTKTYELLEGLRKSSG